MLPKPCKCNKPKVVPIVSIGIDSEMIPLSMVIHKGRPFKEARNFPKKIRDAIIVGLTMLHEEGFDSLEYNDGAMTLTRNNVRFHCTFTYKFLMKESFIELQEALELLSDYLEQQFHKSRARVTTMK